MHQYNILLFHINLGVGMEDIANQLLGVKTEVPAADSHHGMINLRISLISVVTPTNKRVNTWHGWPYVGHKVRRIRWQPQGPGSMGGSTYFATGSYDDEVRITVQ